MQKKLRYCFSLFSFLTAWSVLTMAVHAQCAVCTLAIVGGLGISRWLGVDDTYVGVWLGAAIFGAAGFAGNLVAKRWPQFKSGKWLVMSAVILVAAVALYFADGYVKSGMLTHLTQGLLLGIGGLYLGLYLDKALRQFKNDGGRPYFPFQKVVCPLVMILLATLGAWILVG